MAFKYEKLLLLKWPQNKAAPTIAITENKKRQPYHIPLAFWDKIIDFTDEPEKNSLLDYDDRDDWKLILMGNPNVLFLELVLCIYSFSYLKN